MSDKWFLSVLAVGGVLGISLMAYFSWSLSPLPAVEVEIFAPTAPVPARPELAEMAAVYLEEKATELTLEQLQKSDLVVAQISIKNLGNVNCPCLFYLAKTKAGEVVYSRLPIISLMPANFLPLFRFYAVGSSQLDLVRGRLTVAQESSLQLLILNFIFGGLSGALVAGTPWLLYNRFFGSARGKEEVVSQV